MEKFALKIGSKSYVHVTSDRLTITKNINECSIYNSIGEAMKAAANLNTIFKVPEIKVISIKNIPVSK